MFIFANVSRPCLYFLSVCNSMAWILIRPSAQTCFMSEMLLIAWSLILLTKTCLSRPKIYFSFSKSEPGLYSLTNGFPGKFLGQLTSGWGKGKEWARGLSMHIRAPTQSSCNHVLFISLPGKPEPQCKLTKVTITHISLQREFMRKKHMLTDGGWL